ncbi:cassette chromosome ssDNA-binding protein [Staphylococcus epidermidis]|uniref:cassette chromosome ssDNA-binding protein n=1 Tax=Staphylococcus epidermidis TaxID=1282 RepID=UPI0013680D35|nr:single-stranded DNA-binding protein [Staphylococcus epidermidis]HDZ8708724.1 single-stranded DNA-binding protein [Staphylococcus aureus]MDK7863963.1 single-stranded DNA-binding protein [Staphylococcus epidermidis]MDK8303095.1 single-stranded DNA-binding protein [Staphylococcus epidermidis]MDK8327072.1 single-stranded DNA-binding protein [Staphylococcus epidermidis]NAN39721.1 single-stranded DNA-binding protein [Staphylococcus epidermidis]
MYFNQSDKFEQLKKKILGISFNLPEGEEFTFHDLNSRANVQCSKAVQQNVGRWFAYFVKHAPRVPFVIIGKNTHGHLVYLKTGPNPYNNNNHSKGGVR